MSQKYEYILYNRILYLSGDGNGYLSTRFQVIIFQLCNNGKWAVVAIAN